MLRSIGWILLLAFALPLTASAAEGNGPAIGESVPNLIGRTMDDKPYRLKSDKGSPKVINFFWVECKPCKLEMPELVEMEKQYTGVKFIFIHTEEAKPEIVSKFIQSLPGAAPSNIVLTSGGVQQTFKYAGLPHTLVLDSNNNVLMSLSGYTLENMQRLQAEVERLAIKIH